MRMCTVLACLAALLSSMLLKDGLKIFRWPQVDCRDRVWLTSGQRFQQSVSSISDLEHMMHDPIPLNCRSFQVFQESPSAMTG